MCQRFKYWHRQTQNGHFHLIPTRNKEPGLKYAIQTRLQTVHFLTQTTEPPYKVTVGIGDPCYPSGRALQINGRDIVEQGKNNHLMLKAGEFIEVSSIVEMSQAASGGLIVLSADDGQARQEFDMNAAKKSATRVRG